VHHAGAGVLRAAWDGGPPGRPRCSGPTQQHARAARHRRRVSHAAGTCNTLLLSHVFTYICRHLPCGFHDVRQQPCCCLQETCPQLTSEHGGATGRYCCDERQIHDLSTKVRPRPRQSACECKLSLCPIIGSADHRCWHLCRSPKCSFHPRRFKLGTSFWLAVQRVRTTSSTSSVNLHVRQISPPLPM
jgi:hypothetical protein